MIDFKPLTINEKGLLKPILDSRQSQICNFSFANLIIWGEYLKPSYALVDDVLILQENWDNNFFFCLPIGIKNNKKIINLLRDYAESKGVEFVLHNVTEDVKAELETLFAHQFSYIPSRDFADYLYQRDALETLSGRKLQSKRNHINQFEKRYNYSFHPFTLDDVEPCLQMHERWAMENNCGGENCSLKLEGCAVKYALHHFQELDFIGGVLQVEGKVAAFTLANSINFNTIDVNIEKALDEYKGAYTMINKLFVKSLPENYLYVNREEDMGEEGLRKAKLSYQPMALLQKYNVKML